jgi:hypothetical protein
MANKTNTILAPSVKTYGDWLTRDDYEYFFDSNDFNEEEVYEIAPQLDKIKALKIGKLVYKLIKIKKAQFYVREGIFGKIFVPRNNLKKIRTADASILEGLPMMLGLARE